MSAERVPRYERSKERPRARLSSRASVSVGAMALVVLGLGMGACGLDRGGRASAEGGAGGTSTSSAGQAGMGGVGAGPAGGSGGTGGGQICTGPEQCPGTDTDCGHRTCEAGVCGYEDHEVGHPCDDNGGEVCDGAGTCLKGNGTPCASALECLSGFCADDVCCNGACAGTCEACDLMPIAGSCTPQPLGADPDQECTDGVCNGVGACASGATLWSHHYSATAATDEFGFEIAVDVNGDVIINGDMLGPVDFGGGALPYGGNRDFFVAKFSDAGAHLWSKSFGAAGDQAVWGLAASAIGEVFVSGQFKGNLTVNNSVTATGAKFDVFVAKLDGSGNALWVRHFDDSTGDSDDLSFDLAVDASGDVIVVGHYQGTIAFGSTVLTSSDKRDIFVAKLDGTTGNPLWAKSYGGTDQDWCLSVALDSSGDLFITGSYETALDLGGGLTEAGGEDLYVAKLSGTNGAELWGRGYGDGSYQAGYGVAVDSTGAVFVVGELVGAMDLGGGTVLTSADGADGFVIKLDGSGTLVEARRFGGTDDQYAWGVAVDPYDQVVVTGSFLVQVDFGLGAIAANQAWDAFLAKLGGDLTPIYSHGYPGTDSEMHRNVAIHSSGAIYSTGYFDGTIDFGGGPLTANGIDVLLAKFAP